ncbi:MAG TPA: glycine betaine ABC transporter substrate-binding protein [Blastocatellia bacterium]|jgi:osmoprotectant transport system permease protein|nr:glycine betaine ABC transporter substrate-binding protein [Blastocatellia bacterium]
MRLIEFWLNHGSEFLSAILRHLELVAASTGIAVALGVPLGVLSYRNPRVGAPLVGFANVMQTIPSLAMFGFLIPMPLIGGIGAKAAVIALILYALLPVIRTTTSGLKSVDPSAREAGLAMGMTGWELLYQVELPLARTAILAGVRVATVVGVGTATIAAAIGAGGLGEYIFRGVASVDSVMILAGAIPAAALALAADLTLTWLEKSLAPDRAKSGKSRTWAVATAAGCALLLVIGGLIWSERSGGRIVIGSKDFTEQVILGELLAQTIERSTSIKVQRKFNLGDTLVCETAMRAGDLDLYVEYTGTALTAIFKKPVIMDSAEVNRLVNNGYAATGRVMLPPLGFNNSFVILTRGDEARRLGLKTISEAAKYAPNWRAGFGSAFLDREDGYRGLAQVYGLKFRETPLAMNLSLAYRALAEKQVDLISGEATNGLIAKLDLYPLEDDRRYFPPYHAVPVIRGEVLNRHPELRAVFDRLAGKISDQEMRRMNYEADAEHRDASLIVREFLERHPEVASR